MCGLFGVISYGDCVKQAVINDLLASLGRFSCDRGIDATGIAYLRNNNVVIHKQAKPAYEFSFNLPDSTRVIMGHTRQATQGSQKKAYNNHPFSGACGREHFALAHNGIIYNENELRTKFLIPQPKIETDSYVAVQMLELHNKLSLDSVKDMSEKIEGSFCFTILDMLNNLYIVRGNNPISLIHLKAIKLYVYASTEEILLSSIIYSKLYPRFKNMALSDTRGFEFIKVCPGNILRINTKGAIEKRSFYMIDEPLFRGFHYRNMYTGCSVEAGVDDLV